MKEQPLRGTTLALIAFCAFPIGDAIIKSLAGEWPASAIAALRFAIGACGLGLLLFAREGRQGFRVNRLWLHVARGLALAGGTFFFFNALFVMPLADAVTISFVNPVLTALLSAWLLREPPPAAAWIATVLSLGGLVIMLEPGFENLGWSALLPLASAVCISALMILNRMVSAQRSVWAAQFLMAAWASVFLVLATVAGHFSLPTLEVSTGPSLRVILCCSLVAITASLAHYWLYLATTRATAAAVAPLVYVQLVIASLLSVLVFGDPMDSAILLGGGLIIAGGLFLWWRDRQSMPTKLAPRSEP